MWDGKLEMTNFAQPFVWEGDVIGLYAWFCYIDV